MTDIGRARQSLVAAPDILHLVFASRRGQLPSVRALIDWLVLAFEAAPAE